MGIFLAPQVILMCSWAKAPLPGLTWQGALAAVGVAGDYNHNYPPEVRGMQDYKVPGHSQMNIQEVPVSRGSRCSISNSLDHVTAALLFWEVKLPTTEDSDT